MITSLDLRKEGLVLLRNAMANRRTLSSQKAKLQSLKHSQTLSDAEIDMIGSSGEVAANFMFGGYLGYATDPTRRLLFDLKFEDGRTVEVKTTKSPNKGLQIPARQKNRKSADIYVLMHWDKETEVVTFQGWTTPEVLFTRNTSLSWGKEMFCVPVTDLNKPADFQISK